MTVDVYTKQIDKFPIGKEYKVEGVWYVVTKHGRTRHLGNILAKPIKITSYTTITLKRLSKKRVAELTKEAPDAKPR